MGKNWAITIGINNYYNLQTLKYAKRDAEAMQNWFQREAGFNQVFLFTEDSQPIPASPKGEGCNLERPQHYVTVPALFMGKFEVTQEQYEQVMGKNPSKFKGDKRPVERVSWNDAVEFCKKLGQKTGRTYRLTSEAEWEYACRAGTTTPFHFGETITGKSANYNASKIYVSETKGEYREETTTVGQFPPNAFGLYDMHGNVWEWCQDNWHQNYNGAPKAGRG